MAASTSHELSSLSETPYSSCLDGTQLAFKQSQPPVPRHVDSARKDGDSTSAMKSAISFGIGPPVTGAGEKKPPSKHEPVSPAGNFHSEHDDLHGGRSPMLRCITTYAVVIIILVIVLIAYLATVPRVNRAPHGQVDEGAHATVSKESGRHAVTRVSAGSTDALSKAKPRHSNDHGPSGDRHYENDMDVDVKNKNLDHHFEDDPASNITTLGYEN